MQESGKSGGINPEKAQLMQKYGGNRSVGYFVRKGQQDQATLNRKLLMQKP